MAAPSTGLGRGLTSLLGAAPTVSASRGGGTLPLALMQPGPFQPRRAMHRESLEELAASIKASGVIQPIVVRRLAGAAVDGARYEIVAGERRWEAAKLAGLRDIPTIVRELSDQEAIALALIENIQREELTPAEEARALQRLIGEFSLTHERVAEVVGRSRAAVSNLIRLLDLPESVLALVDAKSISMGHARALLGLTEDAQRTQLAAVVVKRELSVRETEDRVRRALAGEAAAEGLRAQRPVMREVWKTPGVQVRRQQKEDGSTKLVVQIKDAAMGEAILEAIKRTVG